MESLDEQLKEFLVLKDEKHTSSAYGCIDHGKVSELVGKLRQKQCESLNKKIAPSVPPKPSKKNFEMPQVPSSKQVSCSREPLYSQPLMGVDKTINGPIPLRKPASTDWEKSEIQMNNKTTLDNPAILEQQLEALAYHKLQMEKKGLLGVQSQPEKSAISFLETMPNNTENSKLFPKDSRNTYLSIHKDVKHFRPTLSSPQQMLSVCTNLSLENNVEDDVPPPPSPESAVSSSYSELRRASTSAFNKQIDSVQNKEVPSSLLQIYANQYALRNSATIKSSSTYDSIYEPINPRPAGDMMPRESCNPYGSYANDNIMPRTSSNLSIMNPIEASKSLYALGKADCFTESTQKNTGQGLSNYISIAPESIQELENYGRCVKCKSRVLGESSGCTAMDQIYHISCFTCTECQINLQGKPFYALENKPYCEFDYLQTLEKCSVCMEPILERILRATGKPYHPQCFTCIVCGKSLDGLLFTVDATNQNYCITDFHKKFAPRCCVCKQPIMPDPGQEETIRVVALDRSFHLECYKCEDCGLLLSSEAEGRGCYPLDDHVLCKSCNAQRVQALTNRMTSET